MSAELPSTLRFEHEAMNTTFGLRLQHPDPGSAAGIAHQCFELLDRLEGKLSRYIEDSDISRINTMQAGETLYLTEETHACLLRAFDYHARTGGLFDITLGRPIEHRKNPSNTSSPTVEGSLVIHPDTPAVTCQEPGRELDLGGIGKGFALDQLKEHLAVWGVEAGLLSAGASTQLAFGGLDWPVDLTGGNETFRITLRDAALSASGTGIQGSHIVHPDGDRIPLPWKHVWLTASNATAADVWSTTVMLLTENEVLQVPGQIEEVLSLHVEDDTGIRLID
ncbi:MAG: FAD:protein FMN transferase [Verrucomicrobiota bacterium]